MTRFQTQLCRSKMESRVWPAFYIGVSVRLEGKVRAGCSLPVIAVVTNGVWWPLDDHLDPSPQL